jgi:hypothetical protein
VTLRVPGDRPIRPGHRRVRLPAARRQGSPPVLEQAIGTTKIRPIEVVVTDQAPTYPVMLDELLPAWHCTDRYANNRG